MADAPPARMALAPLAVVALLAAQPLRPSATAEVAVVSVAASGAALMVVGLGVGLSARLEGDGSVPVSAWSEDLRARAAGSVGLLGAGLSLLSLAALVGQRRGLALSAYVMPGGVGLRWELQW
jgi:hypothetical protein